MILMIDNFDSFTYNIVQAITAMGAEVKTLRNNQTSIEEIAGMELNGIIISPGPGTPEDAGISRDVIRYFHRKLPMLGVCLGHQCIADVFGGKVMHAGQVMHGKLSLVEHNAQGLFENLPQNFAAVRYHSLAVERGTLPDELEICAESADGEIMALKHRDYPLFGVQFHPESISTEYGVELMKNFVNLTGEIS